MTDTGKFNYGCKVSWEMVSAGCDISLTGCAGLVQPWASSFPWLTAAPGFGTEHQQPQRWEHSGVPTHNIGTASAAWTEICFPAALTACAVHLYLQIHWCYIWFFYSLTFCFRIDQLFLFDMRNCEGDIQQTRLLILQLQNYFRIRAIFNQNIRLPSFFLNYYFK